MWNNFIFLLEDFLLQKNAMKNIILYFTFLPVYLMVIERLMFISLKVYRGEISKNILFENIFSIQSYHTQKLHCLINTFEEAEGPAEKIRFFQKYCS